MITETLSNIVPHVMAVDHNPASATYGGFIITAEAVLTRADGSVYAASGNPIGYTRTVTQNQYVFVKPSTYLPTPPATSVVKNGQGTSVVYNYGDNSFPGGPPAAEEARNGMT